MSRTCDEERDAGHHADPEDLLARGPAEVQVDGGQHAERREPDARGHGGARDRRQQRAGRQTHAQQVRLGVRQGLALAQRPVFPVKHSHWRSSSSIENATHMGSVWLAPQKVDQETDCVSLPAET